MKTIFQIIFLVLMEIVLTTCKREFVNREFPSVLTVSVKSNENNTIIFSGNIILRNSGEITEMGFIWQLNEDPLNMPGFKVISGSKTNSGDFQAEISSSIKKGSTYVVRAYATTGNIRTVGEKIVFVAGSELPIILNKFVPTTGHTFDTIKITGKWFNRSLSLNQVKIENLNSQIVEVNDTVIKCLVPFGLRLKLNTIKVITNGIEGVFNEKFTSLDYPPFGLNKFEPVTGYPGDTIKITGTRFNKTPSLNQVFFNSLRAQIVNGNDSVLICLVPPWISILSNIKVISNGLAETFSDLFTLSGYHSIDGLTAYYPFNGNANDESGYSFNGSVHGALLTTDRFNNPNSAYYFDGINDYISLLPSDPFIGRNNYTISLWVKPTAIPTNTSGIMLSFGSSTYLSYVQAVAYQPDATFFAGSYNIGNNPIQSYARSTYYATSNWIFITVSRNDIYLKLYINGTLFISQTTSVTNGQNADYGTAPFAAIIGGRANLDPNFFFKGVIDEVRIYNKTLSDNEITQLKDLQR